MTKSKNCKFRNPMNKLNSDHKMNEMMKTNPGMVLQPLGSLPNRCLDGSHRTYKQELKNANRYLKYQGYRINQAIFEEGNPWKGFLIWCMLIKNSTSYQTLIYHSIKRNWYWSISSTQAEKELLNVINHLRRWNLRSYIHRVYIEKKNGKLRPIGDPQLNTKAMARAMADMYSYILEPQRDEGNSSNHAYRKKKGTHTAIMELWSNWQNEVKTTREIPKVYEFDFKSFFNTISWESIYMTIGNYIKYEAGDLAVALLNNTRYTWKKLEEESELKIVGTQGNKPIIARYGITQGSPISPILATIVMELSWTPKGLTLYADDGIFIGKWTDLEKWLKQMRYSGPEINEQKTGETNSTFKFLGYYINLIDGFIQVVGEDIAFKLTSDMEALEQWLTKGSRYKKKEACRWEWNVHENAECMNQTISLIPGKPLLAFWVYFFGIFRLEYKGYKWIPFRGVYAYTHTSSNCVSRLLYVARRTKNSKALKQLAKMKFPVWTDKYTHKPVSRKGYLEWNYTNKPIANKRMYPMNAHTVFSYM